MDKIERYCPALQGESDPGTAPQADSTRPAVGIREHRRERRRCLEQRMNPPVRAGGFFSYRPLTQGTVLKAAAMPYLILAFAAAAGVIPVVLGLILVAIAPGRTEAVLAVLRAGRPRTAVIVSLRFGRDRGLQATQRVLSPERYAPLDARAVSETLCPERPVDKPDRLRPPVPPIDRAF